MEQDVINEVNTIHDKAAKLLRARLANLSGAGLNFEKRTGAFFRASTHIDDEGTERVSRLVVPDEEIPAQCADEVAAKRAAATVAMYDVNRAKAQKAVEEARAALEEAEACARKVGDDYDAAVLVVEAFDLPERPANKAAELKATIDRQATEIERLRAMLEAAGIQ